MEFKEKKKHKKRKHHKWEWIFDLFDAAELIGQLLIWLFRGLFHLIVKILE